MYIGFGIQQTELPYSMCQTHFFTKYLYLLTFLIFPWLLLSTNVPSPANRVKGMPPISKADHDLVYIKNDINKGQKNKTGTPQNLSDQ